MLFLDLAMGFFSNYLKRAKRVQGKRITIFIKKSHFESKYSSTSEFEYKLSMLTSKLETSENTKFLLKLNQQLSVKEIKEII